MSIPYWRMLRRAASRRRVPVVAGTAAVAGVGRCGVSVGAWDISCYLLSLVIWRIRTSWVASARGTSPVIRPADMV